MLENYYMAQVFRDEHMARTLAAKLGGSEAKGRVAVVFAGRGHVEHGLGVPARAALLLGAPYVVVLPAKNRDGARPVAVPGQSRYPARKCDFRWIPKGPVASKAPSAVQAR